MRKIEGTATISIEQLDDLRQQQDFFSNMQRDVKGLVQSIDTEEYDKRVKQIDDMSDMPDEKFERLIKEAAGALRVVVSEKSLRKLIHEYIDDEKSEQRYILSEMTEEEFEKIVGIGELLFLTLVAWVISLIFGSMSIPLVFKFGAEKGRVLLLVSFLIPAGICFGIYQLLTMLGVALTDQIVFILLCCSPLLALAWCYVMYQISYRIFVKQEL